MEAYLGHLLTALVMLSGLAGVYAKLQSRLARIEQRFEMEDKYRDERHADMLLRMRDVAYKYCRDECPRRHKRANTAPHGIPAYEEAILK